MHGKIVKYGGPSKTVNWSTVNQGLTFTVLTLYSKLILGLMFLVLGPTVWFPRCDFCFFCGAKLLASSMCVLFRSIFFCFIHVFSLL